MVRSVTLCSICLISICLTLHTLIVLLSTFKETLNSTLHLSFNFCAIFSSGIFQLFPRWSIKDWNLKKWKPSSVKHAPVAICVLFCAWGPLIQYWNNSSSNLSLICVPLGGVIYWQFFLNKVSVALKSFGCKGSW